jgi:hypothetical protein
VGLTLLQKDFRDWLRHADAEAGSRLDLADARGLAVYQNNYRASLMACLEDSYPQLLAWLGDTAFHTAAAHHIDEYPPSSWTLDDYPAGFPADLRAQFPGDPEIADLAELEWRLAECFVAADAAVLDLSTLGDIDWENAQLQLTPSVSLLTMQTNATQIWSSGGRIISRVFVCSILLSISSSPVCRSVLASARFARGSSRIRATKKV